MTTVRETAKAKINLDLRVCRRRDDGYHDLDSLVVFANLGDELVFSPADELTLSIKGRFAGSLAHTQDNLVIKAARRLADLLGRSPHVHIGLEKRLPVAAGLGGGSADAAAALRGLIRLWDLPMTIGDLTSLASELGADVPACLGSRSVRMTGTGERLAPFDLPGPLLMLLVNPGTMMATPTVFKTLDHMSGARVDAMPSDQAWPFQKALLESINDLEAPARRLAPIIDEVLDGLAGEVGCGLARMSGSGGTCFGLFHDPKALDRAEKRLKAHHPDWWVASSACR